MTKKIPNDPVCSTSDAARSVHLSASAGSGKTRALKERYLALVRELERLGLNIDQAVAITFTDKAAAEIKARVTRDLPEPMLKKIIRGRQDLRISTIHSFCMNLLKRYPLEACLPPDFSVLDTRDRSAKEQRAIEDALEAADGDRGIMEPLGEFTADEMIDAVASLLRIRTRLKRLEIDARGPEGLLRRVRSGMAIDLQTQELDALFSGQHWRKQLRDMAGLLLSQGDNAVLCMAGEHALLADVSDPLPAVKLLAALAPVYFNKDRSPAKRAAISKKNFKGRDRGGYEQLFFDIQEGLARAANLASCIRAGQESLSLLRLYQLAEANYQTAKLREGVLDFDDLEIHAYDLLQGSASPDILFRLDRKILAFLVDEFQDTSDIQWAILNRLTEEIFAGQGADKPMPATLFVVGDEKQSIYRFREANYRLIHDVRQKMETNIPAESRAVLTLDKNYRSTPAVIDTVNAVFRALWGPAYVASAPDRTGHQGSVRLIELTRPSAPSEGSFEGTVLAREIKAMISGGTFIHERSRDGAWVERRAEYADCVILLQSRSRLKEYEAALQAEDIRYRVVGGIGFYDEDEVQAVMDVIFFLWNRDDRFALAAALRSRLFGLTDHEIYLLLQEGAPLVDAVKRRHPAEGARLERWIERASLVSLAGLIHDIIVESAAAVRFGRINPQAIFNLDKLLDTAREFDRRGYTTLQDFVEWVKDIRDSEQREATADMNLPGLQGAVSIMTVHKAKGLEYPLVFLPGMNQQPRSVTTGPLAIVEESAGGRIRMAVKDGSNPVYTELWASEREELQREHQRLLYVAMTRAQDHLVMIGLLNGDAGTIKPNTWLSYMHAAAPRPLFDTAATREPGVIQYALPGTGPAQPEQPQRPDAVQKERFDAPSPDLTVLAANLSPIPRSGSAEWITPTALVRREPPGGAVGKRSGRVEPGNVSPLTRGLVLHRCLEQFARTSGYDLPSAIGGYEEIELLPEEKRREFLDDVDRVLLKVVHEPEHAWIFSPGPGSWSELPFLYRKDRLLVNGIIDRVVVTGDTAAVIDYKATLLQGGKDLAFWMDHYRPQVEVYCAAVKEIFGVRSVAGYLLFLDSTMLSLCVKP
jgi:ATP-dependent helicase/nuclease subunit A